MGTTDNLQLIDRVFPCGLSNFMPVPSLQPVRRQAFASQQEFKGVFSGGMGAGEQRVITACAPWDS